MTAPKMSQYINFKMTGTVHVSGEKKKVENHCTSCIDTESNHCTKLLMQNSCLAEIIPKSKFSCRVAPTGLLSNLVGFFLGKT